MPHDVSDARKVAARRSIAPLSYFLTAHTIPPKTASVINTSRTTQGSGIIPDSLHWHHAPSPSGTRGPPLPIRVLPMPQARCCKSPRLPRWSTPPHPAQV